MLTRLHRNFLSPLKSHLNSAHLQRKLSAANNSTPKGPTPESGLDPNAYRYTEKDQETYHRVNQDRSEKKILNKHMRTNLVDFRRTEARERNKNFPFTMQHFSGKEKTNTQQDTSGNMPLS
jgi:hypothetical protein